MAAFAKTNTNGLKTLADIDKAIKRIVSRGEELRRDCHAVLVAIIDHYVEHGDRNKLNDFLVAVAGSLGNSQAIAAVTWVERFVPSLKFNRDKKVKSGVLDKFDSLPGVKREIIDVENLKISEGEERGFINVFTGNARDLPFYILERKAEIKPFDIIVAINALVKKAGEKYEANIKGEGPHNVITFKQLQELQRVATSLKSPEYMKEEPVTPVEPVVEPAADETPAETSTETPVEETAKSPVEAAA